jgi:hypothetical protein
MEIEVRCPACNRDSAVNVFALSINDHVACTHCGASFDFIASPTVVRTKIAERAAKRTLNEGLGARLSRVGHLTADTEMRVARQQRLVQQLKIRGLPTIKAEQLLHALNMTLLQMRNHQDIFTHLAAPSNAALATPGTRAKSSRRRQSSRQQEKK